MREILFRGKTVRWEWVTGLLAHVGNAWYISNKAGVATAYEVIPNTVEQYTGLTDKNGKKIFEGDVVRDEYNGGIARIAFLQQGCGWYLVFKNTDRRMGHRSRNSAYDNDLMLEVIGNIHDNPELLEVSEDA